jgi:hypothetical protein
LEELDKVDIINPNDAFILNIHGYVKNILKDYQGSFKDFDKVDVLEPKNAFTFNKRIFSFTNKKSIITCFK